MSFLLTSCRPGIIYRWGVGKKGDKREFVRTSSRKPGQAFSIESLSIDTESTKNLVRWCEKWVEEYEDDIIALSLKAPQGLDRKLPDKICRSKAKGMLECIHDA